MSKTETTTTLTTLTTTEREEKEEEKKRRRRKVKRWETYSSVEWTTVEMFFDEDLEVVREDQVTCDVVTSSSSSSKKVLEVRLTTRNGKREEKNGSGEKGGGDLALAVDVGEDVDGEDVRVRCGKKKIEVKLKRRLSKKEKTLKSENHHVEKNASLVDEKSSAQKKTDFEKEKAKDAGFKSDDKWARLEYVAEMEEEVETLDGDDGLNKMFQDLYRDADDDQRRAMMKSFVESNGTVLSTDWADVGEKFVEPQAP